MSRVLGTAGRIAATAAALGGGFTIADSLGRGIREEATAGVIFPRRRPKGRLHRPEAGSATRAGDRDCYWRHH